MCAELTSMKILYRKITYIYGKAHMIVVLIILRLDINKLSYIKKCYALILTTRYPNQGKQTRKYRV